MPRAEDNRKLVFKKMERDLLRLAAERQPEHVHSFRTTARRLQILLKLLSPEQGRKHRKLLKLLNRIRKRAGKVRDLDAQLSALRILKVATQPRRKTQLMQEMLELRAKHERTLAKLLSKNDVHDLRKRLRRAAKSLTGGDLRDPLAAARQILASTPASKTVDEEFLHRFRLAVKRARYAAEFAPASADASSFIQHLKLLQDSLGNWHDWFTLTSTASRRFGGVNESPLVAAVQGVTRVKFRDAVAGLSASPLLKPSPLWSVPGRKGARETAGRASSASAA